MRFEDITKNGLSDATDLELKKLKYKFAKFWDRHFKNNDNEIVGCFTRNDLISKYTLLLKEMDDPQRSLQHSTCDIDRQAFKKKMQIKADGIDLSLLEEVTTTQNIVILDENFTKSDEVNITIQAFDAESFCEDIEKKLAKIFKEQFGKSCIFNCEGGFVGKGIPLFHQVIRPVSKVEKIEIKQKSKKVGKEVKKDLELVPIEKGDEQIVYGIVYEPNVKDSQGDQANEEEIRKALYTFMESSQAFKIMHKGKNVRVKTLEAFLAPVDFTVGKRKVKKGSWVHVTRILDKKVWEDIKAGKLTGYSMAGYAKVE